MSDCPRGQEAGHQVECRGEWCRLLTELKLTSLGNSILHLVRMSLLRVTIPSSCSLACETYMVLDIVLSLLQLVTQIT